MFNRDQLQARAGIGYFPAVPAGWPNRATRRAVRFGNEHRLSSDWRQVLAVNNGLRTALRAL